MTTASSTSTATRAPAVKIQSTGGSSNKSTCNGPHSQTVKSARSSKLVVDADAQPRPARDDAAGSRTNSQANVQMGDQISAQIGARIGARKFDIWFDRQTTRLRVEGGSLQVDLANSYVADWIARHYADDLATVAREALGTDATVSMMIAPQSFGRGRDDGSDGTYGCGNGAGNGNATGDDAGQPLSATDDAPGGDPGRHAEDDRRLLRQPPVSRRPSGDTRRPTLRRLDEFVAGPSNQLAYDAARRLAEAAPGAANLLFVHGDCGVGKTHLLQGICERRRALHPRQHVRYTTAEQFTNEYLAALRDGSLEGFRKSLRRLDLLAIDDIHFLSNKTATQSEFLHTMDAIDFGGSRIVLASDEHPRQIRKFSQSLVSRFLSGMVVRVDRPDRQTRLSLVRRLADARGMTLQPGAEEIVANRCVGSVREIEGALSRLAAFASLSDDVTFSAGSRTRNHANGVAGDGSSTGQPSSDGMDIGTLLAERAFDDETVNRPSGPIRMTDIVQRVVARLGVERDDVLGSGRHRRVVLARSLAVYLARQLTTQSYPEIARALGRDTHSTAHTAARRIEQMLADGERVETGDPSLAGPDGATPLKELVAQLRHDITRSAPRV